SLCPPCSNGARRSRSSLRPSVCPTKVRWRGDRGPSTATTSPVKHYERGLEENVDPSSRTTPHHLKHREAGSAPSLPPATLPPVWILPFRFLPPAASLWRALRARPLPCGASDYRRRRAGWGRSEAVCRRRQL